MRVTSTAPEDYNGSNPRMWYFDRFPDNSFIASDESSEYARAAVGLEQDQDTRVPSIITLIFVHASLNKI
jgi:hypothetical protein